MGEGMDLGEICCEECDVGLGPWILIQKSKTGGTWGRERLGVNKYGHIRKWEIWELWD
jgi:hypothetical protein